MCIAMLFLTFLMCVSTYLFGKVNRKTEEEIINIQSGNKGGRF